MISDIQHSDDLEIQFAQLVPAFIENLGNTKVRLQLTIASTLFELVDRAIINRIKLSDFRLIR